MNAFKSAVIVIILLLIALPAFSMGSEENSFMEIQIQVRETLDRLVDAYVNKNAGSFMSFTAENFAGDDVIFDGEIRRDFSKFIDMDLRYTLNNVTTDSKNENISAAVTFTKSYTDVKTTQRVNKTGSAEFIFKMVNGHLKLYKMRRNSMFGI